MAGKKSGNLNGLRLVFIAILIVLAIAIVLVVKNIISLHIERNDLRQQEAALEEKKEELTEELQNVDDLEYIEEQARKLLRMIKPGEVLYIIDDTGSPEEGQDESSEEAPAESASGETPESSGPEGDNSEEADETAEGDSNN